MRLADRDHRHNKAGADNVGQYTPALSPIICRQARPMKP
jgi:hypothetical protein